MAQIKIKLLSDLCCSSGSNHGAHIDGDVCYDKYGLPYIPAKSLKGCLREVALELYEWGIIKDESSINYLFGESDKKNGHLILKNATLFNYDELIKEIDNSKYKSYLSPQNVLDNYTYLRTQTALENGISKENSLRTIRVVKKGLEFVVDFALEDEDCCYLETIKHDFENCCKALKHIGMNRTRGLGHVEITVDYAYIEPEQKKLFNEEGIKQIISGISEKDKYELVLKLKLDSTVMFPKTEGGPTKTESFIPGSSIMGYFASRYSKIKSENKVFKELFIDGNLIFNNAYISDGLDRYIPASAAILKIKDATEEQFGINVLIDKNRDETIQTKALGDKYLNYISNTESVQRANIMTVETEVCYHHMHSMDKAYGTAEGVNFYQYTSMSPKQYFIGKIVGTGLYLKQIIQLIPEDGVLTFGRSKNAQYGRVLLTDIPVCTKLKNETHQAEKFVVQLVSPCILLNEFGVASTKLELLVKAIETVLKEQNGNVKLNPLKTILRYKTVGGYNVTWNMPKPQRIAFDAGTTCLFECENIDISGLNNINIGERISEGFGEILAYSIDAVRPDIKLIDTSSKISEIGVVSDKLTPTLKSILKRIYIRQIHKKAQCDAMDYKNSSIRNATTVGRLLLMCEENENLEEFLKSFTAMKDEDKKKECLKALFSIEDEQIEPLKNQIEKYLLGKYSPVDSMENMEILNRDDIYREYVKAFLIQAKYNLRRAKVESK